VKPHPAFPDTPSLLSMGFKDVEAYLWVGLFTRSGIPEPLFNRSRWRSRSGWRSRR
jgi:hypothetical protein